MKEEELKRLERILTIIRGEVYKDDYSPCYFNEEDIKLMEKTIEFLYGEC
jgi:hypothetical protein